MISHLSSLFHRTVTYKPQHDPVFRFMLKKAGNRIGHERAFMIMNCLEACLTLEGHVCECGVYKGATAYIMAYLMEQNGASDKELYLFDTFQGTPKGSEKDEFDRTGLYHDTSADTVKKHLKAFSIKVVTVPGLLPQTLEPFDLKFCFVHLHLNLYKSTRDTLEEIFDHVTDGGMVLVEDYGIRNCTGVLNATEDFIENAKVSRLILPTGQAILIKR